MKDHNLSMKQLDILKILIKGNGFDANGALIPTDMDQLLERVSYQTTKQSMQFSLRALTRRGLATKGGYENRRNRRRLLLLPTDMAKRLITMRLLESVMEPELIAGAEELMRKLKGPQPEILANVAPEPQTTGAEG